MLASLEDRASLSIVCDFLRKNTAIILDPSKEYLVESRLAPLVEQYGYDSVYQLARAIDNHGQEALRIDVVNAMTTNETSFFRDKHPFDTLRDNVIPNVLKCNKEERTLNIWSNACSSGQEVYSIAILLKEHFSELRNWKVRLIATDISTAILKAAKAGKFNQSEINRGLPMPLLLKYFQKNGLSWQVNREIRDMVEFQQINLIEPFPHLPQFDIVFLRNVLIYFAPDSKGDIMRSIRRLMSPEGYLFLGAAETTMNLDAPFHRKMSGKTAYYTPH